MKVVNWELLKEPFQASEIDWRVGQSGKTAQGKVWCRVLAYLTSRAVMERLDAVFGCDGWEDEYVPGPAGGVVCRLSVHFLDGETERKITREDGAENTDIEGVKGGISGALKRAAVKYGIGRYLYDLPDGWANVHDGGKNRARTKAKDGQRSEAFKWDPPGMPAWALPAGAAPQPSGKTTPPATGKPKPTTTGKAKPEDTEADPFRD